MPLPPGSNDAIYPRPPLRPPRKSFAFTLRTAVSPPGRCIGTRKCRNVKPLRFRDTALAVLLRYLLQLRCYTPLPLCYTLFQRLALLSDTSLVQSAFRQSLLAPFSTASRIVTVICFFPQCGALALFAYGFYVNTLNDYSFAFSIFQNPTLDIFLFSAVFASAHVSVLSKISSSCVDFTFTKLDVLSRCQGQVCTPCSSFLRFVAERQSPLTISSTFAHSFDCSLKTSARGRHFTAQSKV